MEQSNANPILEQENYWEGYKKSIEAYKNNPEVIAFDKMCYELFEATEIGKHFMEYVEFRFFINSQISKGNSTYPTDAIWQEGFRDAYRMIIQSVMSHKQRIKAGTE